MPPAYNRRTLSLLHVDDSSNDREIVRQAIRSAGVPFQLSCAESVQAATPFFDFTPQRAPADHRDRPKVVLLDYDLGLQTGRDFLYWLRTLRGMTAIPVIVYSGSDGLEHADECYDAGANLVLNKPQEFARAVMIVKGLYFCMAFASGRFDHLMRFREYHARPDLVMATGLG